MTGNQANAREIGELGFAFRRSPLFTHRTERRRTGSCHRRISVPNSMNIIARRPKSTIRNS